MPDPELEIRRGPRSSRPLDKGTGRRGGGGLSKTFFGPSGLSLAKNKGGRAPQACPLDPPLVRVSLNSSFPFTQSELENLQKVFFLVMDTSPFSLLDNFWAG